METWKIVLISVAVILVVIGIILAIVIPIVLKKKKSNTVTDIYPETIQLKAVKLEQGSGLFGFETKEELKERLSKLSKEEFIALEVDDYPYNIGQWNSLEGQPEAIMNRNKYEMSIYFAYDYNHNLKEDADILKRVF